MKRNLLMVVALLLPMLLAAQSAVTSGEDALKKIKELTKGASLPMSAAQWNQLKGYLSLAASDPKTANMYQTWEWKLEALVYDRSEALKEFQANGNQFKDMKAFFDLECQIVQTAETYYLLFQRASMKDEERVRRTSGTLQIAMSSLSNLYVGATNYVDSEPAVAVKWLEAYYKAFSHPLFDGSGQKPMAEAAYVYATALKNSGASEAKVVEWLVKALDTSYGPLACQELITRYQQKGDKANELKYLQYAFEHFPSIPVFGINFMQSYIIDRKYAEVIQMADQMIPRDKSGMYVDENGQKDEATWYIYYFKAVSLFNSEKFKEAYDAFVEGDTQYPDHIEMVMGAGTAAAKYANDHFADKAVSKPWFEKALHYFSKAERQWPDRSDQWGYQLYACYHNLGNKAMEEKYKKYLE